MKNFCLDLRKHVTKITSHEKKETTPLTKEEEYKHEKRRFFYICKKPFSADNKI